MASVTNTEVSTWTKSELVRYVGSLSNPSKMPCYGYSLPAQECITGSKLRPVEGTVCNECYALKNRFLFPKVQSAMYRRLASIVQPLWAKAMAELINRTGNGFFRWHDSGDLQSTDHLRQIVKICNLTPDVQHWLPTREIRMVERYVARGGEIPDNLTIRLSAHLVDGKAPEIRGITASTVSRDERPVGAHVCPAPKQDNHCGSCRACWSRDVPIVDYRLH
jgi:hypothetical protein